MSTYKDDQSAAAIQTAMKTDKPMCLSASGVLAECGGSDTLWALPRSPGTTPFTIKTTTHDDQHCLTAPKALENGALESTAAAVEARAEALFPSATSDVSAGYRNAYATSDLLMEQIEAKRALDEQCKGGFGAPQGPLGEIYSTHTTVGDMTWRWVVGVQVASDFNVTAQALGIGQAALEAAVIYAKERTSMGQKLTQLQAIQMKLADMSLRLESVRGARVCGHACVSAPLA